MPEEEGKKETEEEEEKYEDDFSEGEPKKPILQEEKKSMDEEEHMLDVAEHCFIRLAENLISKSKSARTIFQKYSISEQFPDGTILELLSPIAFLEGVKEAGIDGLEEMEAACMLRVLAKPELDNAIILNEFTMIMENFGVPDTFEGEEEEDDLDDYIPEEEEEEDKQGDKKEKRKVVVKMEDFEEKALKILRKLARFLLERYMHPREFFGPAVYKQLVKTKTRENHVDILQTKDFYLRLKIAGIRKTVKENDNLNKALGLDSKFPHLFHVKKLVKALEEVAQTEQVKMHEEMMRRKQEEEELGEDERKQGKHIVNADLMESPLSFDPMGSFPQRAMGPSSAKMALLMGFSHLNTIEEEKHDTQTSNYFRDSERGDDSNVNNPGLRGSKILDESEQSPPKGAAVEEEEYEEDEEEFGEKVVEEKSIEEMKSVEEEEEGYEKEQEKMGEGQEEEESDYDF